MKLSARALLTAAAVVVLSLSNVASAAIIFWGPIGQVTSISSLNQTGAFVTALNMGGSQGTLPIPGTDITFTDAAINEAIGGGAVSNSYNPDYFGTTNNANLDMVLDSHSYISGNNPNSRGRVELTGLTPGTIYILQVIGIADGRECCANRIQYVDDGAGNISNGLRRGNADHVTAVFTADATTQSFFVTGLNDPGLSGVILRAVPEPGSLTFLALAAAGGLLRRRRDA